MLSLPSLPMVYVAGPFRGPTPWDIAENVRAAERVGLEVARAGAYPVIPHANTHHFHGQGPDQWWLDATLELLRRCDAIALVPGWNKSAGAWREHTEAQARKMPVFMWTVDNASTRLSLREWVGHIAHQLADRREVGA